MPASKFRLLNITVSFLIILIIWLDYFVTKELWAEFIQFFGITFLLAINILRQTNILIRSYKVLNLLTNTAIIIAGAFCLAFLAIIFWGYCFTGASIPIVWIVVGILNVSVLVISTIDLKYVETPEGN